MLIIPIGLDSLNEDLGNWERTAVAKAKKKAKKPSKIAKGVPARSGSNSDSSVSIDNVKPNSRRPSELARYSDLFKRMRDPIFLLEPESLEVVDANIAADELLGSGPERRTRVFLDDYIPQSIRGEFQKNLRISKRRYYPRKFYTEMINHDGIRVDLEISSCTLQVSEDETVLQIVANDITRKKIAENKAKQVLRQLQHANKRLQELSITDELTGLYNSRYFRHQLNLEHQRSLRFNTNYCLIFLDIDHFKHFNDTNGHPAGDGVLRQFGSLLKENVRQSDLVARYGGEEFVILCRSVSWAGGHILAERLRKFIEKTKFRHEDAQPGGKITVSVGVSGYPDNGLTSHDVLVAADQALYRSKERGRNQVNVANELLLKLTSSR